MKKIGVHIIVVSGLVCTLYVMMLCGSQSGSMAFGGATYTLKMAHLKSQTSFGWLGVYSTLDGKGLNERGFDDGSATWFSYDEEKWGLSKSDDKVKDMFKGCSQACPASFFLALLGLMLSSAVFSLLFEEHSRTKAINGESENFVLRMDLWPIWIPLCSVLCTLCGVLVLLSFGLGCYRNITAEAVEGSEDVFEVNVGGGFLVAVIATFESMVMTVLVFLHRSTKIGGGGEGKLPGEEAQEGKGVAKLVWIQSEP